MAIEIRQVPKAEGFASEVTPEPREAKERMRDHILNCAHLGEHLGWGVEMRPIEAFEQPEPRECR